MIRELIQKLEILADTYGDQPIMIERDHGGWCEENLTCASLVTFEEMDIDKTTKEPVWTERTGIELVFDGT